jgi:iron complex outermembrane receptor protein
MDARRRNAAYSSVDAWSLSRHAIGTAGARATTLLSVLDRQQGSPGLATLEAERSRTETRRLLGGVSARVPCGRDGHGVESCTMEATTTALVSHVHLIDPLHELSAASRTDTRGRRWGQRARVSARAGRAWDLALIAQTAVEDIAVVSDSDPTADAQRLSFRPALSATWHADSTLQLVGLTALQCESTSAAGRSDDCGVLEPVGRLGVQWQASRAFSLRGNLNRTVRPPTLGELYGFSSVVRGNADLASETGVGVDAGARFESPAGEPVLVFVDLFGFARRASDLIAYRRAGSIVRPFNVRGADVIGAELAATLEAFGLVEDELSVTVLDPRDTTSRVRNDILPFRSRLVLADTLRFRYEAPAGLFDRASLGFGVFHRSSQFADQGGLVVIAAQTTFDVEAQTHWLDERLALRARLANVFDARRFDAVGLPQPGRELSISGEAWWW